MSMTWMWWWNVRDRTVVGTGSEVSGPGERGQGILMLAAAALLALCGGLALPATAEAQTTLVSNIGQGGGHETNYRFPMGAAIHHRFERVRVHPYRRRRRLFQSVSATSTPFTAQVCETDASGFPTSVCTDLTVSVPYDAGTLSLPAPASTTLAQGTTYAVVVGGATVNSKTRSDGEDIPRSRWSIENQYDFLTAVPPTHGPYLVAAGRSSSPSRARRWGAARPRR